MTILIGTQVCLANPFEDKNCRELYEAMLIDEDPRAVALVLADRLEEIGDTDRAELIRIQVKLEEIDGSRYFDRERLRLRAQALIDRNAGNWYPLGVSPVFLRGILIEGRIYIGRDASDDQRVERLARELREQYGARPIFTTSGVVRVGEPPETRSGGSPGDYGPTETLPQRLARGQRHTLLTRILTHRRFFPIFMGMYFLGGTVAYWAAECADRGGEYDTKSFPWYCKCPDGSAVDLIGTKRCPQGNSKK